MNLFEIDRAIADCIDSETGEILDYELLNQLSVERDTKIENVVLYIKNLNAENVAISAEIAAFKKRIEKNDSKVESLERWLSTATAGNKFISAKCSVSWRKSEKVDIADGTVLPDAYCTTKTTTVTSPDKKALKAFLKSGGKIDGVQLVESMNAQIK